MIQFFRRIRQKLITEGRMSKYLIYALGEIALVMIGILLALQVNNWNEGRKSIKQEKVILQSLLADLENNAELIKESRSSYIYHESIGNTWIRMMSSDTANVQKNKLLDSLLYKGPTYEVYDFVTSSIKSVTEGGDFDFIQNQMIKKKILEYNLRIIKYKDYENEIRRIVIERIRPRVETHISIREMYDGSSSFQSDYTALFMDRQLNNDYVNRNWQISDILKSLDTFEEANKHLILLIRKELGL